MGDQQKKRAMFEEFMDSNQDETAVQDIGKKLLGRLGKSAQEQLMEFEKERDANIEQAQCKALAAGGNDTREIQK
jgi:hypothetical protein